jgi:hypothetical protein
MNITKELVVKLIVEAVQKEKAKKKEKTEKLPKSSGKLIDLKKNLAALEQMKIEISTAKFAEKTATTEVEFADLARFAKELDLIKSKGVALEQKLDNQISLLRNKITSETSKIKELMGLTHEAGQEDLQDNQQND